MISSRLLPLVRCPECHAAPSDAGRVWRCPSCGRAYDTAGRHFLDMRPVATFAENTKYLDEALHADARHERVSPPLLAAGVRHWMLRRFLELDAGDTVVDLGCGSGRTLWWNRDVGAHLVGVDVSPYFAHEALDAFDLVLGDLRRLPFRDEAFTKAWSLDVLEHLSPEALAGMLREASRVLAPGGAMFVYTHVRKNSWIAGGLRAINALARGLERLGLIDMTQERLRKSDHLNPLADVPHLERVTAAAGFRIARVRYYTPLVGGFVENILVRVAERAMARRAAAQLGDRPGTDAAAAGVREARAAAKRRIAGAGPTYLALRLVTWAMRLDVWLFGRIRSGPFFALLVKERDASAMAPRATPESGGRQPADRAEP